MGAIISRPALAQLQLTLDSERSGKPLPPTLLNVNLARSRADASAARAAALTVIADAEIGGDFAGDGRWARQVTWV